MNQTFNQVLKSELENLLTDQLMEKIRLELLNLAQNRVPRDTGNLEEQGITATVYPEGNGYKLEVFVNNVTLNYPGKKAPINANYLGMLLDIGTGAGGVTLKRSQSKPNNPMGTPTADWWAQFEKDVDEYFERLEI